MTRFTTSGWICVFLLLHTVLCSLTCDSTCTAIYQTENVTFPCSLLDIDEVTDTWVQECGPDRPSPIHCQQVYINNKTHLGFSWHPPGDSSAKDITGFRILISITNTGDFYPRKSYRMNLTEWKAYLTHPQSTFTLKCVLDDEVDSRYVFAHVISLPKSSQKSCARNSSSCERNKKLTETTQFTPATVHTVTETKTGLGVYIWLPAAFLTSAVLVAFGWFYRGKRKSCMVSHTEESNGHNTLSALPGESQSTQTVSPEHNPGLRRKSDIDDHNIECFNKKPSPKNEKDLKVFICSESHLQEIQQDTIPTLVGNDETDYSSGLDRVCPDCGYLAEAKPTVHCCDCIDDIPPLSDEAAQRVAMRLAAFNEKSENYQ